MQALKGATRAGVTLTFGIITVPVSIHTAVGADEDSAMRTVCAHDHAPTPLKSVFTCPQCGSTDRAEFQKAQERGDAFVIVPPTIIEQNNGVAELTKKSIDLTLHPADQVTSVLLPNGSTYYLSLKNATEATLKAYSLLATIVRDHPEIAFMAKFTIKSAAGIYRLSVAGEHTLTLVQMSDAALVREHPVIEYIEPTQKNLAIADMLLDSETVPFVAAEQGSGKTGIIAAYTEGQVPAGVLAEAVSSPDVPGVADLSAKLEAMLAASKSKKAKKSAKTSAKAS